MTDILKDLEGYPNDPTVVMSRRLVGDVVAEIKRLRAELTDAREAIKDAYFEGWEDAHECGSIWIDWSDSFAKRAYDAALKKASALNKGETDGF